MRLRRIPISGWKQCVHGAASFETVGEFDVARLLDGSAHVEWWWRNDPPKFRIPTPLGYFEPDFLYALRAGPNSFGIVEVKGAIFWDGSGSEARVKADAACEWVKTVNQRDDAHWEVAVILETDVSTVNTLEDLRRNSVQACPAANE